MDFRNDPARYKANFLERIFDRALAMFAPKKAAEIMRNREAFKAFAYKGGQRGNRNREQATIYPNSSPESSLIQLERIQCMWESRSLSDNFGVADYIYKLYCDYCIPDFSKIRWNTGNPDDDRKIKNRFLVWARSFADYTGRDTLNQWMRLCKRSQLRDGDCAIRFVPDTLVMGNLKRKVLRMQIIEADRIGSPFNVVVSETYIGGLILDEETKRVLQYDIYKRPPQGSMYLPQAKIDANEIVHLRSLRRADQYRGIPLLAPALPAYTDLKEILENERIATKAQSNWSMFIQSPTGDATNDDYVYPGTGTQSSVDPGTGLVRTYKDLVPGSIMYGNPGEEPSMLKNERPSPAFQGLVRTLFIEMFCCSGIDYAFGYDPNELQGTAVRLTSAKTQKTFAQDWTFNEEYLFQPVINRWLQFEAGEGYFDDLSAETLQSESYLQYRLTQPAHPSADVGRESQANLAELQSKVKSRHTIASEQGIDWDSENEQIKKEEADLSGGKVAISENLAKSLGEDGIKTLQSFAVAYGTGQISHEIAIGFATVGFGVDSKSAEELFPKSSERPPAPPKPTPEAQNDGPSSPVKNPPDDKEESDEGKERKAMLLVISRLARALDQGQWDESKHPRADNGEFGSGSGATGHLKPTIKTAEGKLVTHEGKELPDHIKSLGIPPAWQNVRISHDPSASILAHGYDAKGRSQSIYSDTHNAQQAILKFNRIKDLSGKIDSVKQINERMRNDPKTKENADVVKLIESTGLRPGSDTDTGAEKQAYGATTLLGKHITQDEKGNVVLDFTGKKGVDLKIPIHDPGVASMLLERKQKSGDDGKVFNTDESKLRDHFHSIAGDFKIKDLRTLKGTSTAKDLIKSMPIPSNPKEYKLAVKQVAEQVSSKLGNTPAMALSAYIDPEVFLDWAHAKPEGKK